MATRLRMNSVKDIRRTLQRISNMVLHGELDSKRANAITYACNSILGAIRVDEQQAKIDELEEMIEEMKD